MIGPVIAVDGPAASGKGTIAKALAAHFGLPHMDTGLLYRGVALQLWRWGGDPGNEFAAMRACADLNLDPSDPELRSEPVSQLASRRSRSIPGSAPPCSTASANSPRMAGGAVLDGRDIGTVIAPHADSQIVRDRGQRSPRPPPPGRARSAAA